MKFIKNASKQQKIVVWRYVAHFEEKNCFVNIVTFYCFEQKGLFITKPNWPQDFPLFKLVAKNKLSKYFRVSF